MTTDDPPPITEHALANLTGVARSVLAGIRGKILTHGEDFANVPGKGITYTPDGLEKIRAALGPLEAQETPQPTDPDPAPKKNGAPPDPAQEVLTLVVARFSGNGGASCLCHVDGAGPPSRRAWATAPGQRQKTRTLRPGMRLEGCTRLHANNPEVFVYHGPVPSRHGLPMPERKEARP